jgi:hypothetical protein
VAFGGRRCNHGLRIRNIFWFYAWAGSSKAEMKIRQLSIKDAHKSQGNNVGFSMPSGKLNTIAQDKFNFDRTSKAADPHQAHGLSAP